MAFGARGFGTVLGAGATDIVTTTLSTDSTQRSWFMWIYFHGLGGSGFGKPLFRGSAANAEQFYNVSNVMHFYRKWSTAAGDWTISPNIVSNGDTDRWVPLGLSYNASLTSNVPVCYYKGAAFSVTGGGASGTLTSLAGSVQVLGNETTANSWNGLLADVAIWNAILTPGEFVALSAGVRPLNIRPASLAGYWPLNGINSPEPDLSGLNNNGILTGTTNAAGPPLTLITPRWPSNVEPAAPTFIPAWARQSNLPVLGTGNY